MERTFTLKSSLPWLVQLRPEEVTLGARQARPIAIAFDALAAPVGIYEALVYINNEDDTNEDCYRVRVKVVSL